VTTNESWVVLIDYSAFDDLENPQFPFHIEPYENFRTNPPNKKWKLHRILSRANDAWAWLDSEDAIKLFQELRNEKKSAVSNYSHKSKVDKAIRIKVLERDNYKCVLCGRSARDGVVLEVDHIIPRAKGGGNNIENLQTLCFDCNRGKRDRLLNNNIKNSGLDEVKE